MSEYLKKTLFKRVINIVSSKISLKIFFSLLILSFIIWKIDFGQVVQILSLLPINIIIIVIIIYFISLFINTLKWLQLLPRQKIIRLFLLTLIAQYYSLILPGQIAGEAVKAYKLGKGRKDAEKIAASVMIDRLTGIIGLMLVAFFGLLWSKTPFVKELTLWFGLGLVVLILFFYLIRFYMFEEFLGYFLNFIKKTFQKTGFWVDRCFSFIDAWKDYLNKPLLLLKSVSLGIVFQLICVLINFILGKTFGIELGFFEWCWVFGVISLVVFLPVTIGGIGLREGGFILLLGILGVSSEKAFAISLSIFGLQIIGAMAGAIIDFGLYFNSYKQKYRA